MTKNITLAVDEELLARFRVLAAERRTSVNALIRQHMEEATGLLEKRREARAWMAAKARENGARDEPGTDGGWRWNREDSYSGPRFDRLRNI
ncbi:MAG: ribbon-helix-helix protein, CopG family [Allosphingosinicella sp.]|uniref:ribbon-helix-helix protein, CopG family n=1 Tax=Allosphingosinicella sp. TaxID=2823234 RepID=UPI00394669BE